MEGCEFFFSSSTLEARAFNHFDYKPLSLIGSEFLKIKIHACGKVELNVSLYDGKNNSCFFYNVCFCKLLDDILSLLTRAVTDIDRCLVDTY